MRGLITREQARGSEMATLRGRRREIRAPVQRTYWALVATGASSSGLAAEC